MTNYCINILDTPGHQDFSEDTYRTLMAADSAVMVIDGSKGVEAQTRKLFKVCVMRHIPIFTLFNKMDRDAMDTFELMDDIENELGIAPVRSTGRSVPVRNSRACMTVTPEHPCFLRHGEGYKEGEDQVLTHDEADSVLLPGPEEDQLCR